MTKALANQRDYRIGGELAVQRLGFGAMRITGPGIWGPPADRENAKAVVRRALELGVNLIDTADAYGPAVSEELIAEALHPYPAGLLIATKGGLTRPGAGQWVSNGRPDYLRGALDASLKRLRLERIDLYQLHAPDPNVPFSDSVGALAEQQRKGKIRYIGLSNVSVAQLAAAQKITPIVSVQNRYNLSDRASEKVLDACEKSGIGFIPWFPLSTGELARAGNKLDKVARELGATTGQVALAWLLQRSPVMLPIPGTGSLAHLEENCGAARVELSPEQWRSLERS
ncbi:MAG TPA: aldo/keto reductase [Polyangiales bacterium]|nr:aldo/keto reductase [Polyangiales bacterium]